MEPDLSNSPTSPATKRFEQGDSVIARDPVSASMTDGSVLHGFVYENITPPSGRQAKIARSTAPLLCIPDDLGNCREFSAFALKALSQPNAPKRLYCIDLRGRGRSIDTPVAHTTVETDADDIISLCDALGLHHVDIVANGRGASALFLTAPKRPGLVRKLVLNDAGPEFDSVGIARTSALRKRLRQPQNWSEAAKSLETNLKEQFPEFEADDWLAFAKTVWLDHSGQPAEGFAKSLQRMSNDQDYDSKQLQLWPEFRIYRTIPSLLIWGERSLLMTLPIVETMKATLPLLEVVTAEGQGHTPRLERGNLTEAILDFLAR